MTKHRIIIMAAALLLLGAIGIGGVMRAQGQSVFDVDEETAASCAVETETIVTEEGDATSTVTVRCDGGTCVVARDAADVVTSECTGDQGCAVSEENAAADDGTTVRTLTVQCDGSTVTIQRCGGGNGDQRAVNRGGSQTITQESSVVDGHSTTTTSTSTSTTTSISTTSSSSTSTTVTQGSVSQGCGTAGGSGATEAGLRARDVAASRRAERARLVEERRSGTRRIR